MTVLRSLSSIKCFQKLSAERRQQVERACAWRTFEDGQMILNFQDHSREVFFLVSGKARSIIYAASGRVVAFGDQPAGSMFGEIGAIDGKPRAVAVEALSTSTVATLSHQDFLELATSEPEFTLALLQQIVANLRMLTARIFEYSTLNGQRSDPRGIAATCRATACRCGRPADHAVAFAEAFRYCRSRQYAA